MAVVTRPQCIGCGDEVDGEGFTTSACAYGPNTCEDCGGCFCDGAC